MSYSIYSRFRGAILGLAIGARFCNPSRHYLSPPSAFAPQQQQPPVNQTPPQQNYSSNASVIIRLVVAGMKSIIHQGRFDLEDWHHAIGKDVRSNPLNSIIATLPVALFYHENEIKLRETLQVIVAGQDDHYRDIALAFGYAIALSLQVHPTELISQTITFVGVQTQISQKLASVKTLLEHNAVREIATPLDNHPTSSFALALYCYLSTVSDFRLSLRRVMQKCPQPHICAITGALSGAYNGISSIPVTLRQPLSPASKQNWGEGMTTEEEMLKLCDALVAVWSGVYSLSNKYADLNQVAAFAAPRFIRTR